MTSQPPSGNYPPPGQPPQVPPPGSGGVPAKFDPKSVNPLDWGILGAGVLALIFSTFGYYTYSVSVSGFGGGSVSFSAWHGFFGWFAVLLALVGAGAVAASIFAPQVKLPAPARLIGLGAFGVATLCVILALFVVPGDTGGASALGVNVDKGHGFGYWVSLIVILAGTVLSLMRLQATGGQLPGGLSERIPNIGGYGPQGGIGAQQQPPPPPGYGPQDGIGGQQQPPPGYGPPR